MRKKKPSGAWVVVRSVRVAEPEIATMPATPEDSKRVIDAARDAGSRFVWWPPSRYVDPRRMRYRGQPMTAADLDELGPFELRRLLTSGEVVEVAGWAAI